MKRFVVRLLINALALWLTTLLVAGVKVVPFAPIGSDPGTQSGAVEVILTYLLVALIFGIVNGVIGNFIRVVAFPVYILTLGLIALVVNGLLLLLVAWISDGLGFGLEVEGFWWGVLGALVLALFSWIIGIVLRPLIGRR
ncbi:MAG: phage holin family protein [Actinomycetota bacterium]|nr:phage holin family protein [Actinomycetota bacterium]